MPRVDILLPTCNRPLALAMALAGVAAQTLRDMRLIVADQSDTPSTDAPTIASLERIIKAHTHRPVEWHHRPSRLGIAEQRDFLLQRAEAPYVLYLDDDVWMQPWVVQRLSDTLEAQRCGFVGAFPTGLSFLHDVRPQQQEVEFWEGPVRPEAVEPGSPAWERHHLHRAANLHHATLRHNPSGTRLYKVAWVACCVLYDRQKLQQIGGFGFWPRLPRYHSGEEVLVQNLLMRRWGGCALMPAGTFHAEEPSTVLNSAGGVDGHALDLLQDMVARYAPSTARSAHG